MNDLPARDIFTPSQLNTLARDLLESSFALVWVEAELGNVTRPASGHLYFTLKDARAQVRCAMFKPKSTWLKFPPREGLRVLARGRVTLYEARGEYQMVLDHMEEAGEGALRRAFDELRARLAEEGLFDDARKRALPALPQRIAVITSPSGAVIRDMLSVLDRRFPLVEIDILPTQVQGNAAAGLITALLRKAGNSGRYAAIVLARGGGSLEDLWPFNDEALVRAIAASPVPVVSAVGHETDFTLADFAADVRAPTPSVAAELLVPSRVDLQGQLRAQLHRLEQHNQRQLQQRAQQLDRALLRLNAQRPQARLEQLTHRQAEALRRLEMAWHAGLQHAQARMRHAAAVLRVHDPKRRLVTRREYLHTLKSRQQAALVHTLQRDALRLRGLARSLEAISPLATVARGYALITTADGAMVRSTSQVKSGDAVQARVADGSLKLRVE